MSEVVVDTNIGDKTNFREQIKSYFNKKLHVIVTDGRIIIGSFQGSLVLEGATEYYGIQDAHVDISKPNACIDFVKESYDRIVANQTTDELVSRPMSMVMIPGEHIVSCYALIEE